MIMIIIIMDTFYDYELNLKLWITIWFITYQSEKGIYINMKIISYEY